MKILKSAIEDPNFPFKSTHAHLSFLAPNKEVARPAFKKRGPGGLGANLRAICQKGKADFRQRTFKVRKFNYS